MGTAKSDDDSDSDEADDEGTDVERDDEDNSKSEEEENGRQKKRQKRDVHGSSGKGISADDILASMPKTDKQIRHERRLKKLERDERKKQRQMKRLGDRESGFELVPSSSSINEEDEDIDKDVAFANLTDAQKKKVIEAR